MNKATLELINNLGTLSDKDLDAIRNAINEEFYARQNPGGTFHGTVDNGKSKY